MERAKPISEMKTKNDFLIKKNNSTKTLSSNKAKMPHNADTRCGLFRISLNKNIIHEMILGFGYTERENVNYWDSKFSFYVKDIEEMIPQSQYSNFENWFCDNYNNTEIFDDIFKPEEEEDEALKKIKEMIEKKQIDPSTLDWDFSNLKE
jgi:hypothetical protein